LCLLRNHLWYSRERNGRIRKLTRGDSREAIGRGGKGSEGDNRPPGQQTSAIAFPSLMQVSAVGQQNDPESHFVVLVGQFVADSAQPPPREVIY